MWVSFNYISIFNSINSYIIFMTYLHVIQALPVRFYVYSFLVDLWLYLYLSIISIIALLHMVFILIMCTIRLKDKISCCMIKNTCFLFRVRSSVTELCITIRNLYKHHKHGACTRRSWIVLLTLLNI